ncbi:MAG: hypothetical protein ACP5PX_03220 [Candidatus Hadarchaeum sp.]|uniref:hypothetical protein n=1 Tax=Candidatus Hadarchaeum sp. TaxID=2883567 RepID=UPI003D144E68
MVKAALVYLPAPGAGVRESPKISTQLLGLACFILMLEERMTLENVDLHIPLTNSMIMVFSTVTVTTYPLPKKHSILSFAITYSSGMKNSPIAMGITITSFGKVTALPIAVSYIFQIATAIAFYMLFRKKR